MRYCSKVAVFYSITGANTGLNKTEIKMSDAFKLLGYRPAELREGAESVVIYYVADPETGKPVRKRVKLNHIKTKTERKKVAAKLISEINSRLHNGWNPITAQEAPRAYTQIESALNMFMQVQQRSNHRPSTMRMYQSWLKSFWNWMMDNGYSNMFVISFEAKHANAYMNHLLIDREISAKTWNNYLTFQKVVWKWFVGQQISKTNPFAGIKPKKSQQKTRVIVQGEELTAIWERMFDDCHELYLITRLIFYCLLRPKEISLLVRSDVNLDQRTIRLRSDVSKSRRTSYKTIPDIIHSEIQQLCSRCPSDGSLLFSKGLRPGIKQVKPGYMGQKWRDFRAANGLNPRLQLYSFKDSGIVDMFNAGIPEPDIMRQADHTTGEITRIYADHINPEGQKRMRQFHTVRSKR